MSIAYGLLRTIRLSLAVSLVVALLSACGGDSDSTAGTKASQSGEADAIRNSEEVVESVASPASSERSAETTPDIALARLHRALQGDDSSVFHTTMTQSFERDGESIELWTIDFWLDLSRNVARSEYRRGPGGSRDSLEAATTILSEGDVYVGSPGGSFQRTPTRPCLPIEDAPVLSFLICDPAAGGNSGAYPLVHDMTSIRIGENVEYEDASAIALIFGQEIGTIRLFVDAETFLPLAWVSEAPVMGRRVVEFENEFVPVDELPDDFFDPVANGYQEPDAVLDGRDLGYDVYWLGRELDPGNGLPALSLDAVYVFDHAELQYGPGVPGQAQIIITSWPRPAWEGVLSRGAGDPYVDVLLRLQDSPCTRTETMSIDAGEAVIYQTYEALTTEEPDTCPNASFDRYFAIVNAGDTIVAINALYNPAGPADPYNSLDGMRAVVTSLFVRPPSPGAESSSSLPAPTATPLPDQKTTLAGTGDTRSEPIRLSQGLAVFTLTWSESPAPDVRLQNMSTSHEVADLSVTNDEHMSTRVVAIDAEGEYIVDVQAAAKWTLDISQPVPMMHNILEPPQTFRGSGAQVISFLGLQTGRYQFTASHSGDGAFVVHAYEYVGLNYHEFFGDQVLFDAVGPFEGVAVLEIGDLGGTSALVQVIADSEWVLSVEYIPPFP